MWPQLVVLRHGEHRVTIERGPGGRCFVCTPDERIPTDSLRARFLVQEALGLPSTPPRETKVNLGPPPISGHISNNTYPPDSWYFDCVLVTPDGGTHSHAGSAPSLSAAAAAVLNGMNDEDGNV